MIVSNVFFNTNPSIGCFRRCLKILFGRVVLFMLNVFSNVVPGLSTVFYLFIYFIFSFGSEALADSLRKCFQAGWFGGLKMFEEVVAF